MIDPQGDVMSTANYDTNLVTDYWYDAYGNKTGGGTPVTPYNYRNQYYDSETGLYYLNARYYDPEIGAFTQADTYWGSIGDPATLNLYSYCGYNPVMSSDPSGHRFVPASMSAEQYDSKGDPQETRKSKKAKKSPRYIGFSIHEQDSNILSGSDSTAMLPLKYEYLRFQSEENSSGMDSTMRTMTQIRQKPEYI
jgi:RHS repeat-associated protein